MAVYRLERDKIWFPDPELAEPDGLLAVGGDLSAERLVLAYSNGIFPWYNENDPILWWCPKERFVILPGQVHISHSMKKFLRNHDVRNEINKNFDEVIHNCRMKWKASGGTWITEEMENAYCGLYRAGFALSLETYVDGELAGGLYGVRLGRCFFGESMFSVRPNGSKLALISLSDYLADRGFLMIDCQFHTDHLEAMGGVPMDYDEYMELIRKGTEEKKVR